MYKSRRNWTCTVAADKHVYYANSRQYRSCHSYQLRHSSSRSQCALCHELKRCVATDALASMGSSKLANCVIQLHSAPNDLERILLCNQSAQAPYHTKSSSRGLQVYLFCLSEAEAPWTERNPSYVQGGCRQLRALASKRLPIMGSTRAPKATTCTLSQDKGLPLDTLTRTDVFASTLSGKHDVFDVSTTGKHKPSTATQCTRCIAAITSTPNSM